MTSSSDRINWVIAGAVAALCVAFVARGAAIDASLPLVMVSLTLAIVVAAEDVRRWLGLSIPAVIAASITIPSDSLRAGFVGVVVAVVVCWALASRTEDGFLPSGAAAGMAIGALIPLRLVPVEGTIVWRELIVLASALLLVAVSSRQRRVDVSWVIFTIFICAVVPDAPERAVMLPLAVGLARAVPSARSYFVPAAALALVAPGGRWAVAIVGIAIVGWAAERVSASFSVAAAPPFLLQRAAAILRPAIVSARPLYALSSQPRGRTVAAALFIGTALLLRPAPALWFVLAAGAVLFPRPAAKRFREDLLGFVALFLLVSFFPWSGASRAIPPVPVAGIVAIVLILMLVVAPLIRSSAAMSLAAAAVAAAVLFFIPAIGVDVQLVDAAPIPGQSASVNPVRRSERVRVAISGAKISGIDAGTKAGTLAYLDDSGRGYQRELFVGDLADWAAFRGDQFFSTRNSLPSGPKRIEGWGRDAFVGGAGTFELDAARPISMITLTASPDLPANALLQFERIEYERR